MTEAVEVKRAELRVVEFSGTSWEIGFQHGTQLKGLAERMLKNQIYDRVGKEVSKEQLLNHARKHTPFIEEYSPESFEKLRGISEGSGISVDELVLLNMAEELSTDPVAKQFSPLNSAHCTSFGATGSATKDGETYIGQNWDYLSELYWNGEGPFIQRERRKSGPSVTAYNAPGFLAWAGMNSNGIALSWNSLPRVSLKVGVPTYVIIDELLRAKNIGEALAAVERANRAGVFNFVIADENGEVYDVEATPEEVNFSYHDTILGHANHFVNLERAQETHFRSWLKPDGGRSPNLDTIVRHNRMNKMLKDAQGRIDLEACEGFLRDHVNSPSSICIHDAEGCKGFTWESWVMVPRKRQWWIARQPQCQNEYKLFQVN